jgi:hypothetical protein
MPHPFVFVEGTRFTVHQLLAELANGRSIRDLAFEYDVKESLFKAALEELTRKLEICGGKFHYVEVVKTEDSEALVGRLRNWKFAQATKHLTGQPVYVREVVETLARSFGDCGWFEGDMGLIVGAALNVLYRIDEDGKGA